MSIFSKWTWNLSLLLFQKDIKSFRIKKISFLFQVMWTRLRLGNGINFLMFIMCMWGVELEMKKNKLKVDIIH